MLTPFRSPQEGEDFDELAEPTGFESADPAFLA